MVKEIVTNQKAGIAHYKSLVNPRMMDEIAKKILDIVVHQKRYKDKNYSAKLLAKDLGTNTRYVSAVVGLRFHMNYTSLVNKYRIEEAARILADRQFDDLNVEQVCDMVGFSNRQSFYTAFTKFQNTTPRLFRQMHREDNETAAL